MHAAADALERAARVRLMLFDVDGVLTDGRLCYGPAGETLKCFHARDGHGLKMLAEAGIATGLVSGRASPAVAARAAELGIGHVLQGVADKRAALEALLARLSLSSADAGFMGDELVDLAAMRRCGFACAPADAPEIVRSHAHYVCAAAGGAGAAREVCEYLLSAQGRLEPLLARYLR